jgi:hypothetical protein
MLLESTLNFAKNPNKNIYNANWKQWQCCYQCGCYHLATTSCKWSMTTVTTEWTSTSGEEERSAREETKVSWKGKVTERMSNWRERRIDWENEQKEKDGERKQQKAREKSQQRSTPLTDAEHMCQHRESTRIYHPDKAKIAKEKNRQSKHRIWSRESEEERWERLRKQREQWRLFGNFGPLFDFFLLFGMGHDECNDVISNKQSKKKVMVPEHQLDESKIVSILRTRCTSLAIVPVR